jgi:hypothetical protein
MLTRLVPAFLLLIPALSAQPCAPDSTSEFPGSIQQISHDQIRLSLNTGRTFDITNDLVFTRAVRACRLAHDQFLILGEGGDGSFLPSVYIVDVQAGRLLDNFYAHEPALSPDRRWLAFWRFYPLHTDYLPSDQYMLYDLSRSSEKQRVIDILQMDAPGQPVYPIEKPFFTMGYDEMPPEERHSADSSIYWSSDSRLFLFSESTVAGKNVVVVRLIGKPFTYVNTNSSAASCLSSSRQTGIADLRLVTGSARNWQISITSSAKGCAESPLIISSDDLRPAPIQKHKPLSPPAPSIQIERPIP